MDYRIELEISTGYLGYDMEKEEAIQQVGLYIEEGYHCSEAFIKGLGPLFSQIDVDNLTKYSSGFGGGLGMTKQNTCGLLAGGVMIISALLGRNELRCENKEDDEIDKRCQEICAEYRLRFLDKIKATRCCEIRVMGYGSNGIPCSTLSREMAEVFINLCEDYHLFDE